VSTGNFALPTDFLRWHPTCHHNDNRLMSLAKSFVEAPKQQKKAMLFYLWGHSYEFDGLNNWNVIEEFAQYIGGKDHIWYATNIEMIDYINAYRSLRFSADGTRVYNPTLIEVWFAEKGKLFSVAPGQTITIA
jgi:hypothetical protein